MCGRKAEEVRERDKLIDRQIDIKIDTLKFR